MTTRVLAALALAAVLGLITNTPAAAADPMLPDAKTYDKLVIASLREVHNKGAELYNTSKEFAAAYRLYQGALEAVKPLLVHRPEAQKLIDTGLATAQKEADAARKAFVLHETIEAVRKYLKVVNGLAKLEAPPQKPEEKKGDKKPNGATLSGVMTLMGKPLAEGEITVVSLNLPAPRVFTAAIKDGEYTFTEPIPPAQYAVTVTGKGVPEKYHLVSGSGLRFEVKGGKNEIRLDLK